MRVAILLEGMALGGCPLNALDLAGALRRRGHHVEVIAIEEQVAHSWLPLAEAAGFEVTVIPTDDGLVRRGRRLRRLLADRRIDVLHAYAPWLGPAAHLAVTGTARACLVTNWTMTSEAGWFGPHTPLIVGTGGLLEEGSRRHLGTVWLMQPPIDLEKEGPDPAAAAEFRRTYGIGADEVLVSIIGRVDHAMKIDSLRAALAAVDLLRDPRIRLVVVGDGTAMDEVRSLAADVNARQGREAVVLTGLLLDPHPAYAASDVALAMGGSAVRALSHALPLVVLGEHGFARIFDRASAPEFLTTGFYGTDPVTDAGGHLAALVREVVDHPQRADLGSFGREEVARQLGLEQAATDLEGYYRSTLQTLPGTGVRARDAAVLVARDAVHRARARRREDTEAHPARERVLLVTHEASRSGAPRVAQLVGRVLREKHDLRVVSLRPGPLLAEFAALAPTSVEPLHTERRRARHLPGWERVRPALDRAVARRVLARQAPTLVYVNSTAAAAYVAPALEAGCRVVLHVHESRDVAAHFLARAGLAGLSGLPREVVVVACSPSVHREMVELLGRDEDDVRLVPSVPDDVAVRQGATSPPDHDYPADALVVGCVGTVEHRKGADLWVRMAEEVLARLPDLPVRFVWVGDTGDGVPATSSPRIAFVGPSANPWAHLARFDVGTLPSRDDPFPLVVLESMLLGTPVVAFDVGGVATQIGATGTLVPPEDPHSFADAVVRLLTDQDERRRLGSAASARADELFSTRAFGAEIAAVVGGVRGPGLSRGSRPSRASLR